MAEATDDKDLLAIQSGFENKRVLGKLGEFREFGEEQAKSLNNYFGLMKDKFGVNAGSTYDTGKLIGEVVEKRNKVGLSKLCDFHHKFLLKISDVNRFFSKVGSGQSRPGSETLVITGLYNRFSKFDPDPV